MIKKNILFQAIAQFGGRLLSYVFFLYAARILGVKEFGIFSYVFTIGCIVSIFMDFGLDPLFVKWVAQREAAIYEKVLQTRSLTIVMGLSFMIAMSMFMEEKLHNSMIFIALGFACLSLFNISARFFRGIEKMGWEALFSIIQRGLLLGMGVFLLRYWKKADSASFVYFVSHMIACVGIIWVFKRLSNFSFRLFLNFQYKNILMILKEGLPIALVGFFGMVYFRIDSIMLAMFWNMEEVGQYNCAYRLMEGLLLIPGVIMAATFPRLSRQAKEGGHEFKKMFNTIAFVMLGLSLIVAMLSYYLAPIFFKSILGAEYLKSIDIFRVLLLAAIGVYLGYLVTQSLIALDKQRLYLYIALMGMCVNIILNLIWIPRFGGKGAAWATVLTEWAVTLCGLAGTIIRLKSHNFPHFLNRSDLQG